MRSTYLLIAVLIASAAISAQTKSNDAMANQIKALKADKTFTLTYDKGSGMSKVMGSSESFTGAEAKKAGIQAMSFGTAFFYQGQALAAAADPIALTFWVMTKKPQFAANHKWTASAMRSTRRNRPITWNISISRYRAKTSKNSPGRRM